MLTLSFFILIHLLHYTLYYILNPTCEAFTLLLLPTKQGSASHERHLRAEHVCNTISLCQVPPDEGAAKQGRK